MSIIVVEGIFPGVKEYKHYKYEFMSGGGGGPMKKQKKRFLLTMVFLFSFLIALLLLPSVALAENWTQDATGGGGNTNNTCISSMAVYGSQLYMGTEDGVNGCEVWAFDGVNFSVIVGPGAPVASGFGTANNIRARTMTTYGGLLYVGTWNWTTRKSTSMEAPAHWAIPSEQPAHAFW